ncbi:hypothetical protein SJY04_08740 [Aeromonas dhakensis]|uniref:hypothetical protein n=1 Tax=Aeromonas dhakensis TaxID=196024 RepID=UPI00037A4701|nr:hypothetical protein [Aeromonas dhakensis]MDX7741207.1 hypothetical protein [Aeromonas dhakensis]
MKKTLIALAVAGLSFNAAATVTIGDSTTVKSYASEIAMPATLTNAGTALDVKTPIAFSATKDVKRYVRFDLTNAEFATAITSDKLTTDATYDPGSGAVPVDLRASVSVGGGVGSKFVVIEINPIATLENTANLTLALNKVKALSGEASVNYRLYETGVDANAGNDKILAQKEGKLFTSKSALTVAVVKGADRKIDVTQESKFFTDDAQKNIKATDVGTLTVKADGDVLDANSANMTMAKLVKTSAVVVTGDFSAGKKDADKKLDKSAVAFGAKAAADEITATKAQFNFDPAADVAASVLKFTVDGETAIEAQDMTVKFVPVAQDGYTVSTLDLGVIGTLAKNGSSAIANLVLAPDTSYTNLVRISNTSGIAGKFFITAIADDGKNVTFALSDVAGQPASLAAGASTQQMKVADIYAAAQAKGLALTGDKKLRLKVEGEVGSLSLQNYTVSKDGNALNTMNAF